jgi:lysozyme
MRPPSLAFLCFALLLPSGCSSTSGVDALQLPALSHEKTGSIGRPQGEIVPPAAVGAAPDAEMAVADEPKKPEPLQAIDEMAPPKRPARTPRVARGTIYS